MNFGSDVLVVEVVMGPDYTVNDPRGWCGDPERGAALGRPSIHIRGFNGRLYLRRIRLDSGGYDQLGTYFGSGLPLYWVASADNSVDYMLRAETRASAKRQVWAEYPAALFR
jgi:hypothetical protein